MQAMEDDRVGVQVNPELEWLKRRQNGIGSSQSPVLVLGEVYKRTPLDVYLSKKTEPEIATPGPDLRRGHTYEPLAVAMFEQRTGIKVYAPETDQERYHDFQCWDPDRAWIYADFDGLCEDGWVLEVKSPRQRKCDRFRTEGAIDYYQVQCHHLAHVANVATDLPHGLSAIFRGQCKGTRLVIYEPENVDLIIIEIPYDKEMIELLLNVCERFWKEHVLPEVPPFTPAPKPARKKRNTSGRGGKYTPVQGVAWDEAAGAYFLAKQLENVAHLRVRQSAAVVQDVMREKGLTHIITDSGLKFQLAKQAGRRTLDKKALKAAHPNIDLDDFTTQGDDFMAFRAYGAAKDGEADSFGEGLVSVREELEAFAGRDLDPEAAQDVFDELRNQAELYERLLLVEGEGLKAALEAAAAACIKKVTRS